MKVFARDMQQKSRATYLGALGTQTIFIHVLFQKGCYLIENSRATESGFMRWCVRMECTFLKDLCFQTCIQMPRIPGRNANRDVAKMRRGFARLLQKVNDPQKGTTPLLLQGFLPFCLGFWGQAWFVST